MLQMFGQMMMMPLSMATTGMNMMTGSLAGGRGDGRAGWNASLGRWLGGCCGSREGPNGGGGGGTARLASGAAGWTAREGRSASGSGNAVAGSGYRSGTEQRQPVSGYRSGNESRPQRESRSGSEPNDSRREYRSVSDAASSVEYRAGRDSRPPIEYRRGTEPRSGLLSGSRIERDCGCGKRSEGAKNHDSYREERRMSDCSCCEDRHTTVYLVKYWIVNVRHCAEKHFVGEGVRAFADEIEGCNLDTWLLGEWIREHPNEVPGVEQKYLRIKVERLDSWPTMDDCCDRHRGPREVDVLQNINKTLERYLGGRHGGAYESTQSAAS